MPRLKLTLAYEGTRYAGWQLQAHTEGGPSTVQGMLERAVAAIISPPGGRIPLHGAGRTDAGVHAEAQVCHLDLPENTPRVDWTRALNTRLPDDIRVLDAAFVPPSFHARKSALRKHYAYSLWTHARQKAPPRIQAFVWSAPPLDLARMERAAFFLTGEHDFTSFQNTGTDIRNPVRVLHSINARPGTVAGLACPDGWPVLTFTFCGNGFLKQMVRNIMGLLVWAGRGRIDPESVPALLAARDRTALPSPTAPARGLTLAAVEY